MKTSFQTVFASYKAYVQTNFESYFESNVEKYFDTNLKVMLTLIVKII